MFENFTFDTPRSPSLDSNDTTSSAQSRSVSPCSTTTPYPVSYSVTDLAADFERQRLRKDSDIYSRPCEAYANFDDDAVWAIEPEFGTQMPYATRVRTGSTHSISTSRRRDRQSATRLLCSAAHHKDIANLVSRMIDGGEQCSICPPIAIPVSRDEEASISSEEHDQIVDLAPLSRQSSGLSYTRTKAYRPSPNLRRTGSATICKDIRLRKDRPRHQKRSDTK